MLLMHISHNTDYFKSVITFAQFGRDEDATREFTNNVDITEELLGKTDTNFKVCVARV